MFWARLAQTLLWTFTDIDKQLLFSIGSPNCTISTFPGWGVGKCVTKENPKSALDLDLGFVKILEFFNGARGSGLKIRNKVKQSIGAKAGEFEEQFRYLTDTLKTFKTVDIYLEI